MTPTILVVEDEPAIQELVVINLKHAGFLVVRAGSAEEAESAIRAALPDLVLLDWMLPGQSGVALAKKIRADERTREMPIIMLTARVHEEDKVQGLEAGADDYVTKPFDVEELKLIVNKTLERRSLIDENRAFRRAQRERGSVGNIIGSSEKMNAVFQMIETVSEVQSTILITGESGTGKELVARAIHDLGPRAERPFVSINCGAFTETLLESELFGYVKGSFTGANTNRKGLFEAADKGTIFLDEIGEMSPAMQVKLLRVLQERKVRPVGAHAEIPVDARVIAATNRDLKAMSLDGSFREDLFYRISVIPIALPPLRERPDDIPLLVDHFVRKFSEQAGRDLKVSAKALEILEKYAWHGNVRELEHTVERAVALERTEEIQPERLPDHITNYNPERISADFNIPDGGVDLTSHLANLERRYVMEALRRCGGNQTKAADLLKMPVRSLRHLLDKHDIRTLSAQMRQGE